MSRVEKNWFEWIVFATSLVLVLGTIGYLSYDALTMGDDPPTIAVQLGQPEQRADSYVVPVSITNDGDQTAESVIVEVTLASGADSEDAEFQVDFLPRRSTRAGWVTFKRDPQGGTLEAKIRGYGRP